VGAGEKIGVTPRAAAAEHGHRSDARRRDVRWPAGRRNDGANPFYSAHSRDSETTIVQHIDFTHRVGATTHPLT
jgi:hypothetical protein